MTPKHLLILLLAIVASQVVAGQTEEDIPIENDNQFPPDTHTDPDGGKKEEVELEGSGDGDKSATSATSIIEPPIENMEEVHDIHIESASTSDELLCPTECSCSLEGGTNNFITDCSGHELTEFPNNIDPRTTILNIQNNKLTIIPKAVSSLTKLKILKANNNSIMELATGSISELPDLEVLNLAGNRLIEYPQDLKNSFTLTKLEDLDLGGNDMRTVLTTENFINFKSLRKVTLAIFAPESAEDLCTALKEKLETVCIGSCTEQSIECSNIPHDFKEKEELLGVLPSSIIATLDSDNSDSVINSNSDKEGDLKTTKEDIEQTTAINNDITTASETTSKSDELSLRTAINQAPRTVAAADGDNSDSVVESNIDKEDDLKKTIKNDVTNLSETTTKADEFSLRNAVNQAPSGIVASNTLVEAPKDATSGTKGETDPNVNIGATTKENKTGGVDKSVIGIIIAGMVIVVAGITIKKNWNSIKNRFGSTSRTPNESGAGVNGTAAPEEVPLQDKSPV